MRPVSGNIRPLLATARIANVPSVVSNVCLGAILAQGEISYRTFFASASGILLYLAGNFFNDWHDRFWDAIHRPERALPRGLFSPTVYLAIFALTAAAGMGAAIFAGRSCAMAAAAILALIFIYTRLHKLTPLAMVPMGLCRAGLVMLGLGSISGAQNPSSALLAALAIFCYIAGISLSARYESMPRPPAGPLAGARFLLLGAGILPAMWGGTFFSCVPYFAWLMLTLTLFKKPLSRQVSALLAGIPLLDLILVLPAAHDGMIWVAPTAFVAALILQRLAPAT